MADPPVIAALYVETDGAYFGLDDVDPWDAERDARKYDGPWPVVAHPPCQRWGSFAKPNETRYGYKVGDDDGCFAAALASVRTFGGVLEHPAGSLAWRHFGLPEPYWTGGWSLSLDGSWVCYVEQGRYGHPVKKATWLYAYGVNPPELRWGFQPDRVTGDYQRWAQVRYEGDEERPRLPSSWNNRTPEDFRDVLLSIARSAHAALREDARAA
jgi:hypothetical protein